MGNGGGGRDIVPEDIGKGIDMLVPSKRWRHFAAMALIGDGVMAMVRPERDATAWMVGPKAWKRLMRGMGRRPMLTRAVGAAQVVGGIWWALYQEKED